MLEQVRGAIGRKLQHMKPIEPFAPFTDRW